MTYLTDDGMRKALKEQHPGDGKINEMTFGEIKE